MSTLVAAVWVGFGGMAWAVTPPANVVAAAAAEDLGTESSEESDATTAPTAAADVGATEETPSASPARPYQAIIARNTFGLKPAPPAPPPIEQPPTVTVSNLKLTGITTLFGDRRAAFALQEPGKPPVYSGLMREDEWDYSVITNLHVLKIDERAGEVRVVYGGKELAMNFKDNGIAPPVGPPVPVGVPGVPGGGPGRPPAPTLIPGGTPVAAAGASVAPPGVIPPVASFPQPSSAFTPASSSGLRSIPTRPTRLSPAGGGGLGAVNTTFDSGSASLTAGQPQVPSAQPSLTADQQMLIMRAQQEYMEKQRGIPMPPLPPMPGEVSTPPTTSQPYQLGAPPPLPGQ